MYKPRILIADDEAEIRSVLNKFLSGLIECDIAEAVDGRQALELLKKGPYDLVLMDIKMPGISGIDATKKIKEDYPGLEVLVISAWDSQSVASEALQAGASDYIPKPFQMKDIFNEISIILKKMGKFLPKK